MAIGKIKSYLTLVIVAVFNTISANAIDREQLYNAYLHADINPWRAALQTLTVSNSDSLLSALDIEYNYLAWASTLDIGDNKERLEIFRQHIETYSQQCTTSDVDVFRSAYHVYWLSINHSSSLTHAGKALYYANRAAADTSNWRAMMHNGFMYFYRPRYAGGNKQKALNYLQQAMKIIAQQADTTNNWNYNNIQLHISMCKEKLGYQN